MLLIVFWLGDEYETVYSSTVLVIIPSLIYVPHEIGISAITVQNKVKYQAVLYVGMAGINLILGYILASLYGSRGLCISILIAYAFRIVGTDLILKKKLFLDIKQFLNKVFLCMGIPFLGAMVLAYACHFITTEGLFGFITKGMLVVVLYVGIMWIFSLNNSEKQLLLHFIKRLI